MAFTKLYITLPPTLSKEIREVVPKKGLSGLIARLLRKWLDEKKGEK